MRLGFADPNQTTLEDTFGLYALNEQRSGGPAGGPRPATHYPQLPSSGGWLQDNMQWVMLAAGAAFVLALMGRRR